jgi:hypothetical protein
MLTDQTELLPLFAPLIDKLVKDVILRWFYLIVLHCEYW